MKLTEITCFFIFSFFTYSFGQNVWVQTNGPFGGTVTALYYSKEKNIYAGTHYGLYISKDKGESWTKILDKSINAIKETENGIIYIGRLPGINEKDRVYFSTDKGKNWQPTKSQPECYSVTCIESDYKGNIILGSSSNGVFKSSDRGSSWTSLNNGLQDVSISDIKSNNKLIILGSEKGGIYISKDLGSNWIPINSGLSNLEINAISLKANGNIIICNKDGVYETPNENIKWVKLYSGSTKQIFPKNNNELFIITYKGIFYTKDNGKNWLEKNNGINTVDVNNILFLSKNSLICGTEYIGIYSSDDNGFYWKKSNRGLSNLDISEIAFNSKGDMFVCSHGAGLFKSIDEGSSWVTINNGLQDFHIKDIEIGINDEITIGTSKGVYTSSNNGELWEKESLFLDNYDENIKDIHLITKDGFNKILIGSFDGLVLRESPTSFYKKTFPYHVDLIKSIGEKIFIIGSKHLGNQEIYESDDEGKNWTEINSGYDNLHFWNVKIDKNNNFIAGTNSGLMISSDLCKSWKTIRAGFTENYDWGTITYHLVKSLLVLDNGYVYASFGDSKLYFSKGIWENLDLDNNGLPNSVDINDIKISPNGYLYLGTSSHGLFKTKDKVR